MRTRLILLLSLGLNGILAALFLYQGQISTTDLGPVRPLRAASISPGGTRTNVVVRRRNFIWSDIESADYREYINNLRSIGCPENTIRDIIIADVNQLYEHKRSTQVITSEQQWWKSEPDPRVIQAAMEKQEALEGERRALLTELLGPGWDKEATPPMPPVTTMVLDGPILGDLTPRVRQALDQVEARAQARREELAQRVKEGHPLDPVEVARLRQETRDELAKVLTPPQLEEYLLRYSQNATTLREELAGLNASPEEFRSIFRARDALDQQIALYYSGDDPASVKRKKEIEEQREAAIQQAIGPDRYTMYKYTQDPLFRQAQAAAEQVGAPAEKVLPLFEINQAAQRELSRVQADTSMTVEQQNEALRGIRQSTQDSIRKVLGPDAYELYTKNSAASASTRAAQ